MCRMSCASSAAVRAPMLCSSVLCCISLIVHIAKYEEQSYDSERSRPWTENDTEVLKLCLLIETAYYVDSLPLCGFSTDTVCWAQQRLVIDKGTQWALCVEMKRKPCYCYCISTFFAQCKYMNDKIAITNMNV